MHKLNVIKSCNGVYGEVDSIHLVICLHCMCTDYTSDVRICNNVNYVLTPMFSILQTMGRPIYKSKRHVNSYSISYNSSQYVFTDERPI